MKEAFLKRLFSTIKCGNCGKKYQGADVQILGHEDDLWFLSADCSHCKTKGLIVAIVQKESRKVKAPTDLTEDEGSRFAGSEVVSFDDILDLHNFLKGFDGDFAGLFSRK